MWPAIYPCGFTECMRLMPFPWWCVAEGCCRLLDRRLVARWFIRRQRRRRFAVRRFTRKNHFDREHPAIGTILRKVAKDTYAQALMEWLNRDVVKIFRKHHVFDKEGLFIGDGCTCLFRYLCMKGRRHVLRWAEPSRDVGNNMTDDDRGARVVVSGNAVIRW